MFLSKTEVAVMLGYSISRLNTLLLKNEIPLHRLAGGNNRILKHDAISCMMYHKPYKKLSLQQRQFVSEVSDGF
ncbi:MAG: hypothetical protein HOI38_04655 [Candidatus Marinimicrobia bacterium]|jgi:hypothetical protein|nr:hypothetical protein [Candidatus Neomarinimicrobiota bacterium]